MMFEMAMVSGAVILLVVLVLFILVVKTRRAMRELANDKAELSARITAMEEELSAMMDGTFGMSEQLELLRRNLKNAIEKQQQLDQRDLGELPYNQAVRLASQGAGEEELVKQCGLSRAEAELTLLLHQSSGAGAANENAAESEEKSPS